MSCSCRHIRALARRAPSCHRHDRFGATRRNTPGGREVSAESARQLAEQLANADTPAEGRARLRNVAIERERELLEAILERWESRDVTGGELAAALMSAQRALESERSREDLELIWTGPRPDGSTLRRTDQALFEVVDRAAGRLLVVTFAAYSVPELEKRLRSAAERGVAIRLVLESPSSEGGESLIRPAPCAAWSSARGRDLPLAPGQSTS